MNLNMSGVKRGLLAMYDCVSECVLSVEDGVLKNHQKPPNLWPADTTDGARKRKKAARYSIRVEYSSSNPPKPVLARTESVIDEGGFDLKLPPNRFRTRSVAIVAGYCPERLYSNMPPGAFVVESGVYKVGADRDYVKSEPIYWKQVVYGGGGGGGSEGSGGGTYPRHPRTGPETQILHEPRLVADSNLELRQTGGPGTARLRASSPLDQDRPLTAFLSPAGNQSDISSVPHPSSADRSLPSTLLTNPQSSLSSPNLSLEQTQSSSRTRSSRFPSLRTIPEDSRLSVQADIHASDYSNLAEYSSGLHSSDTPVSTRLEQELYRQNISYLGHHGFPGFPGYPFIAPVHRAISPSKQYPAYTQPAQHIQPPRIADIGVVGVDPREVDIYQRIAQIDPETERSQRPLATSSPPHKRKAEGEVEAGSGGGGRRSVVQKPRFPTPPGRRVSTTSPTGRVVTFDTLNLSQRSGAQPAQPAQAAQPGGQRRGGGGRPGVLRHRKEERDVDSVSVVSEGLDAEVTAITSSSSPGSSGSNTLQPDTKTEEREERSESSGIASKNTSNLTSSSHSTSAGSASLHHSSLSPENPSLSAVITTSKLSKKSPSSSLLSSKLERLEDTILYENWPPRPQQYLAVPTHLALTSGVPPFIIHPATSRARSRTAVSSPDTSIDSPASRSSRPNSSQSAPLDRSVDRHYEWDRATVDDSSLPSLPPEWGVRRSPAYNPRRDRDLGHLVTQSTRERVFSDSEIYSNVFPRRRLQQDVEARVRAMKKEFKEFRKSQNASPIDSDRLESLI